MRWQKPLKIAIPVTILLLLIVYGFWPQAVLVDTAVVKRAPLVVTIEEEGKTRVIDRYVITAPVAGVACRHDLNVGDHIEQNETLLALDPKQSEILDPRRRAQAEANVSAARSSLRAAKEKASAARADAEYAATELKRIEKLFSAGHASHDELDKARTNANSAAAAKRSADFAVDVARYELEAAKTALKYSAAKDVDPADKVPIKSPITGKILKIHYECEGVVQVAQPLLEIGDTSRLEVEIDVLSEDAVKIKPGMPVRFLRWGGDKDLLGRVRNVEPVGFTKISALGVEEQRVLVIADFVSPYEVWSSLGDGYRVEASFILWKGDDVLQIPTSALFRNHGDWSVFVVNGGKARTRDIKTGKRSGLSVQITEGLEAGEIVIEHPDDLISDGVSVKSR